MSSGINFYAFGADYTNIASCLFAIQVTGDSGGFGDNAEIIRLLNILEGDVLRKLYNKTIIILGRLEGVTVTPEYLLGDFEYLDFSILDFNVGYADDRNNGYSSRFQTILNIFAVFYSRSSELSDADIQDLNTTLIAVLDAIAALQAYLIQAGFNLCVTTSQLFNNSQSLYLQAAGSNGTDGIAEGIHLRWSLSGDLGNNHLPQGNYYDSVSSPTGYNKANDYVIVSRTPYINPIRFTLDFQMAIPAIDNAGYRWTYVLNLVSNGQQLTNTFRLSFVDTLSYRKLAVIKNPQLDPFGFLKLYNGLIAITIDNQTVFSIGYDFRLQSGLSAALKVQGTSISGADTQTVNIRKTITATTSAPVTGAILGDNINHIQLLKSAGGYLQSLSFETYADFVSTRLVTDWTVIGSEFALSLTDQVVFDRLETADYPIDDRWPQYRDGTLMRVANYHDKWLTTHPNDQSIKDAVQRYLLLSETDPRAMDVLKDDDAPDDADGLSISYLDVLNLMALDYHWARMLGLGYIDTQINTQGSGQYIYKISYTNRESLTSPQIVTYEYLSIPTGKADSRLPEKPVMNPLKYTPQEQNGSNAGSFTGDGYSNYANFRIINISRGLYNYESITSSFFLNLSPAEDFNIFDHTTAILYGIEYRPADQANYIKPGITNDEIMGFEYYAYDADFPETGVLETVPVPDSPTSLYLHFEKQQGVHAYAIYGVNWFARASDLSNEESTDDTVFPARNYLQPPGGLTAQYIQKEEPLIFTTATEQTWLNGRNTQFPGQDIGFTRITFNWLDMVNISDVVDMSTLDYTSVIKPTEVKTWFKPDQPLQVSGMIRGAEAVADQPNQLKLITGTYNIITGLQIGAQIAQGDILRFIGSLLITPEGQFAISSIQANPLGAIFVVEKVLQVETVEDPDDPGFYGSRDVYVSPALYSRFTVTENLSQSSNWLPVTETVQLIDYGNASAPVIEDTPDSAGNITRFLIGGISGSAVVQQLSDTTDQSVMPGYYSVAFDAGVSLAPHPQSTLPFDPAAPDTNAPGSLHVPYVDWYNGQIRMPIAGSSEKKLLNVIRIVQTNPLVVYVYDGGYQDNTIQLSATETDLIPRVNFHPGYKAYLYPEPPPAHAFNGANMLPGAGESNKKTLLGLQMVDADPNRNGFSSSVSLPAILMAVKIVEPVQLPGPITYGLKVRPDATTKAAFTFDMKIAPDDNGAARSPFGFMFYRTTDEDTLGALYSPDTIAGILTSLAALTTDDHYNQRYLELANLTFDPANPGNFKVFDALPDPYGFPVPDKAGLIAAGDSIPIKTGKYQAAILSTLLPLTAQTPIYSLIKTGYQTDNKLPTIRTIDGDLIGPTDPSFDPFPMIRKYTNSGEANTAYIRFSDYNLNGASRFLYFYAGAEVTNKLVIGPLSSFAGPVSILHTIPAEVPVVRYFTLGPPITISTAPIVVSFFITPFSSEDTITKVRVFRTFDQNKALSLYTMDSHVDMDIVLDPQNGIVITDDFSDLLTVPSGELIYYRLAFIRTIINERDESEDVVGLGSDIITVKLIDTINPTAPALTYVLDGSNNLTLNWLPTTNKGTYYLYTQNNRGNWQRIDTVSPGASVDPMEYQPSDPLVLTDADGNRIYYRYKVKVENSSGLLNLADNELTI